LDQVTGNEPVNEGSVILDVLASEILQLRGKQHRIWVLGDSIQRIPTQPINDKRRERGKEVNESREGLEGREPECRTKGREMLKARSRVADKNRGIRSYESVVNENLDIRKTGNDIIKDVARDLAIRSSIW
jgi:hypothetical protein